MNNDVAMTLAKQVQATIFRCALGKTKTKQNENNKLNSYLTINAMLPLPRTDFYPGFLCKPFREREGGGGCIDLQMLFQGNFGSTSTFMSQIQVRSLKNSISWSNVLPLFYNNKWYKNRYKTIF